jgi:hypothetical protein
MNDARRLFDKARRSNRAADWHAAADAAEDAGMDAIASKAREMAKAADKREGGQ